MKPWQREAMNSEPPVISFIKSVGQRLSVFFKIAGICILVGLLHIPLALTHGVLRERQGFRSAAEQEISSSWGRQQVVAGPVLAVPYAYRAAVVRTRLVDGRKVEAEEPELIAATAYFLPDTLDAKAGVEPEVRHRGIYDTVVYTTKLRLTGVVKPDFAAAGIAADRVDWGKARLQFGVSDLRGVRSVALVEVASARAAEFESTDANGLLPLEARLEGLAEGRSLGFNLEAVIQGSGWLQFVPVGKKTAVAIESPWADPSFTGAYLPADRNVVEGGFSARWETAHFSRGFPASWSDRNVAAKTMQDALAQAAFGVRFANLVDAYSSVERAQKYGVLFFVLIFAVFFLFEVTAGLRIHPLQYALVGAALCLFFLGFLALSEFWPTGRAYAAAAAACTLMVAGYAWSFLRTGLRTGLIGGGLAATYGYLYFVLQSQDFALLAGTAALFAVLAGVMFFTRKVDWFVPDQPEPPRVSN
jgi:inner membrane protein